MVMTETNRNKLNLAAYLEEDHAPAKPRICYELECSNFALPDEEYCAEHSDKKPLNLPGLGEDAEAKAILRAKTAVVDDRLATNPKLNARRTSPTRTCALEGCNQPSLLGSDGCSSEHSTKYLQAARAKFRQEALAEEKTNGHATMPESSSQRHKRIKRNANGKLSNIVTDVPKTKEEVKQEIAALGGTVIASGSKTDGEKLQLNVLKASEIETVKLEWLVPGMIPLAKLTLFAGKGETGKTTVALDLAARISRGLEFPGGIKNDWGKKKVLLCVTEDDLGDTVVPNLMAAGADLDMIGFLRITSVVDDSVKMRKLQLQTDIVLVTNALKKNPEYALVVLDPLFSFVGKANKNDDEIMRPIMEELQKTCAVTKTAFIGIIHYNKKSDLDAVQGISGAGSIGNVARVIWNFAADPNKKDENFMSKAKGNILKRTQAGMKYTMAEEQVTLSNGDHDFKPKVVWLGTHDHSADEVQKMVRDARFGKNDTKASNGVKIIQEILATAPMLSTEVYDALKIAGIGDRTQKDCTREARVHHNLRGKRWWMSLPPNCAVPCKDCGTEEATLADKHNSKEPL
jgi:hypothetical protein